MEQINKGTVPPKTLRISSHDLLVATNRPTSGEGYTLLKKALDRLSGVKIKTNIKTNRREITERFGLIDKYTIIESSRVKKRMVRLEITLSDWFYNSIIGKEVLTINREYFRLGKALERRLYEIARKHCGKNPEWSIGLRKLKEKTGSTSHLDKFRFFIREIERKDHLPDYSIELLDNEVVTFRLNKEFVGIDDLPRIKPETIERARKITEEAGTDWDFQELHTQFALSLMSKKFVPDNTDGAFIGFIRYKLRQLDY
ncbi:replication initiator protein A [Flavilitoribacter nigricans]|nr:replication initiator protein A [Flavilitoribacter nigricans]